MSIAPTLGSSAARIAAMLGACWGLWGCSTAPMSSAQTAGSGGNAAHAGGTFEIAAGGATTAGHADSGSGAAGASAGRAGQPAAGSGGVDVAAGSGGRSEAAGRGGAGQSGTGGGGGQSGVAGQSADTACDQPSDCGYGEIDHDIASKADCLCLFGCPYLPLNKQAIERRASQYSSMCESRVDGQGHPCPVDDCIQLPAPNCVDHVCVAVRK